MKKTTLLKLLALGFASSMPFAQAYTITVDFPGSSLNYSTTVGSSFDASIYLSNAPDLGSFDFSITYDSTKLSALSFTSSSIFGAGADNTAYFLKDVNNNDVASLITTAAGNGKVHFVEAISGTSSVYTGPSGVNATAATLLGTLHFQALALATNSLVSIENLPAPTLSDFNGIALPNAGSTIQGAFVTIKQPAAVPLPSAIWLFAPGLLALISRKKR